VERDETAGSLAAEAAARVREIVAAAERQADARVADAVGGLLERIDAIRSELEALRSEVAALARPPAAEPPAPVEAAPAPGGVRSTDEAGARLVALNMALEGSPRDATARYLAEQFELPDLDGLLDDVYASAGR
jgi:hypothetical protein